MGDQFPDQVAETIGQFRVMPNAAVGGKGEREDLAQRTGVLRFIDNAVELEVCPSFTPIVSWIQTGPHSFAGGPPEESVADGSVVLGAIVSQPGDISLWGVDSIRRELLGFPSPIDEEQRSREVLSADWCLVGGLFPDVETEFSSVALDVTGLQAFASMPSVRAARPKPGMSQQRWVLDRPDPAIGTTSVPLTGEVKLSPVATFSPPGGPDVRVTSDTRLRFAFIGTIPLPAVVFDIAIPISNLLTILYGSTCRVRKLNVSTSGGTSSADVYGDALDLSTARDAAGKPLLLLDHAGGADFIGRWLDLVKRTSPVPQILAAAYSGEFVTIEAEALNLCAAAETLHRRLNPGARRWTTETVEEGISGLTESPMPAEVRQALTQALCQHLYEPSFPMRIEALAARVAAVLPSCVGRVNRWKQAVTAQRNYLAHGLPREDGDIDMEKMHHITRSLRWVLTLSLLLEAGVEPERLADETRAHRRYESDCRNWLRAWPRVFADLD